MTEIVKDHLIARVQGGSNHPINLKTTPKKPEQNKHNHHGVLLPHQKWLHDMDWDSTVLCSEVKRRMHQLIDDFGPDMYFPEAVRDWTKIDESFRKRNGILVPNRFSMGPKPHVYSSHD